MSTQVPPVTTRYATRVTAIADIEALERRPYDELVPARNLYQLFQATAAHHPDRPALTVLTRGTPDATGVSLTHRELLAEISRAANLFRALGVTPEGGPVAFLSPTLPELPAALLGAQVAGRASSINYLLSEDAIVDLLQAQDAAVLVVPSEAADAAIWAKVEPVVKRVATLKAVLVMGDVAGLPGGRLTGYRAAIAGQPEQLAFDLTADRDTVCALFHTGGTTGRPKLVQLTHGNQVHAAWGFAQVFGFDESDAVINGFPLFHVGGTLTVGLSVLSAGGHVVMPSAYALRSPEVIQNYWRLVERFRATIVSGVPTSIAALAEIPVAGCDIGSVRMGVTGGSVCPKAVSDRFRERTGIRLYETYGMTETAAAIAFNPGRGEPMQGSVGFRAPFARTRIVQIGEGALQDCQPLESGLVLVKGPQVFPGYLDPAQNRGVLTDDGWLVTGDIGYLTADERLVLTGREKDLIVRSGHNIDPAAIEDVANTFTGVQMSSAVGMPDAYAGEVPILFVVPAPNRSIDVGLLNQHIEDNIHEPPAKPRRVVVLDALPVTAVGKVFKPALRDRAVVEKVRLEIARILGAETPAEISVDRDARLNTVVTVRVDSDNAAALRALAEALLPLPQTYTVVGRAR